LLGFVDRNQEFLTVEHQKRLHCGVASSLVPVQKGVICYDGKSKDSRLVVKGGIEIPTFELHPRLGKSGLQRPQIPDGISTARILDNQAVQFQHFPERQVTH